MQKFIININTPDEQVIADEQVVCHVISTSLPLHSLEDFIMQIRQTQSLILLCGENALELCQSYKCDGVVVNINNDLPYKKQILPLREKLGNKKIIGVVIPLSRHASMIVGETEPEFIAFNVDSDDEIEKARQLIEWYNELFLIQSAAAGCVSASLLSGLGTDFVMISPKKYKILVAKKESLD